MPPEAPVFTSDTHICIELTAAHAQATRWWIDPHHATLLAALLQAGADLPSSCRNGTCRACLSQVLQGSVTHVIEWPSLSADERAAGMCLPCVARATSPSLQLRTGCLFET